MAFKLGSEERKIKNSDNVKTYSQKLNEELKSKHDDAMKSFNDSTTSYQNLKRVKAILNEQYKEGQSNKKNLENPGTIKSSPPQDQIRFGTDAEYYEKALKRGDFGDDDRKYIGEEGATTYLSGTADLDKVKEADRLRIENYKRGIYLSKNLVADDQGPQYRSPEQEKAMIQSMKPTRPEDPDYRDDEKISLMKSKNVSFLPVDRQEPELKKALPPKLVKNKSDYFTIIPAKHHTNDKNILKDSAGREVDRVTDKEFRETYGDILKQGTTYTVKGNRKQRWYIKK